ncbi:MAG: ABC transporter permease [Acidobacteriia bacterium]|nr:ABC transporter permease [Terriglobia bacterium]
MKAHDVVELAARNLRESVLRNSLTTVGIAVGVASLVAMLSLGIGLQQLANRRLTRSGLFNTIYVMPRDVDRGPSRRNQPNTPARPLDDAAVADIGRVAHVAEVNPEMRFMAEARYADKSRFIMVAALPPSARDREAFDGMTGKFFSGPDAEEVILESDFAKDLAPDPKSLVGKEIILQYAERGGSPQQKGSAAPPSNSGDESNTVGELIASGFSVNRREKALRVVGIVEHEPGAGFGAMGRGRVFVPTALANKLNVMLGSDLREMVRTSYRGRAYMALAVRVDKPSQVEPAENAIKNMGFSTFSLLDATRSLRRFFTILDMFLGIFGSLALAVALLGIVNTLVMAILERRREIGIMKAIGAGDGDIKALFFAEAGVMGFLGGLVGVSLGWAIGRAINAGTNIYLKRLDMTPETFWSVPWWLVAAALAFAVVVSLGSGIYPASRAAKLDPVQALRYE